MEKKACSERIRAGLEYAGITQIELSRRTGIPKSAISQYIKGSFEPKQDRIYLISATLGVSEAWLMGFDVPMTKQKIPPEMDGKVNKLIQIMQDLTDEELDKLLDYAQLLTLRRDQ